MPRKRKAAPAEGAVFLKGMPTTSPLPPSPERYVPGTSRTTGLESEHRYAAAAALCRGKTVLDVASGEGYGSRILSQTASHVTGVDLNAEAVENAQRIYGGEKLDFVCADALKLPFEDGAFEAVVSFESIEHLPSPEQFVKELRRVLAPEGLLILSSPNKTPFDFYHATRHETNDYHINELEEDEVIRLLRGSFANVRAHRQNAFYNSIILGSERRAYLVRDDQDDLLWQDDLCNTQYVLLLASDAALPELPTTFYLDARYRAAHGYWEDDEAVLNQFGLRGEFERVQHAAHVLEQQLAEAGDRQQQLEADLDASRAESAARAADAAEKTALVEEWGAKAAQLVADAAAARSERDLFQQQLLNREAKLAETAGEKAFMDARFQEQKKQLEKLDRDLAAREKAAAEAAQELAKRKEEAAAAAASEKLLQQRIGETEAALAKEKENGDRLNQAKAALETEKAALKDQLKAQRETAEKTARELEKSRAAAEKTAAELADREARLALIQQELKECADAFAARDEAYRQASEELAAAKQALEETRTARDAAARSGKEASAKAEESAAALADREARLAALQETLKERAEELAARDAAYRQASEELAAAKQALEEARAARDAAAKTGDEARAKAEKSATELAARQTEIAALQKDLKERGTALAARDAECRKMSAAIAVGEERLRKLEAQLAAGTEELARLQQEDKMGRLLRSRLETRIEANEEQRRQLSDDLAAKQEQLIKTIQHNTKIESELEMAKNQFSDLNSQFRAASDEKNRLAAECAVLKQALAALRTQSESELRRKDAERENERKQAEEREQLLNDLQQQLQTQNEALAARQAELSALQDEREALNRTIAERDRELAARQTSLDRLTRQLGAQDQLLGRVTADTDAIKNENAQLRQTLSNLAGDLASLHGSFEKYRNRPSAKFFELPAVSAKAVSSALSRSTYSLMHGLASHLPVSAVRRQRFADSCNRKLGWAFRDIKAYQEWQRISELKKSLIRDEDTGLLIPDDVPLTSIIIPVYNNLELTRTCLASIYAIGIKVPFEIVIVDDCSTQNIASLKKEFPEIRIVRNEKNLGFLRTSNHGAAEARGEYLLFLNNDTEVLKGWLDELAVALYRHPEAGMIGSQLIHYSNGKLQESGNYICRTGEVIPLGRGQDPWHPEFSFFREVDFCSAASIIVRRELFEKVGGFDEFYAPAYFEDPDLALKFKKLGYKNYVMPLSKVLHHEMASYGDTYDTGCARNRLRFCERWEEFLSKATYESWDDMRRNYRFTKPRLLYIDAEYPQPDRGSGGLDAIFFMEYFLKRGYDIVFHGEYTPGYAPKYTAILLRMGIECVYAPYHYIWDFFRSNGFSFSVIFVSRVYQAQCFDTLIHTYCPDAVTIFDTVDIHFVREKREAELHQSEKEMKHAIETEHLELAISRRSDATIVISTEEKDMLVKDYGMENIWHIPQAREIAGCKKGFKEREGMVFIGSAHPPNLDALLYFVQEILPLVLKTDPKCHLTVIGEALRDQIRTRPEYREVAKCPYITFAGFVADLGDYLNDAKLTIAPLRYGAGTKGKIASSMSYGVPAVSTRFGTEGTGMVNGGDILIANTPEEFANAIHQLLTNEEVWERISAGGLEFLRRNYAPESVSAMMDEMMEAAFERHRRVRARSPRLTDPAQLSRAAAAIAGSRALLIPEETLVQVLCNEIVPQNTASICLLPEKNGRRMKNAFPGAFRNLSIGKLSPSGSLITGAAEEAQFDFLLFCDHEASATEIVRIMKNNRKRLRPGGVFLVSLPPVYFDFIGFFTGLKAIGYQNDYLMTTPEDSVSVVVAASRNIPKSDEREIW